MGVLFAVVLAGAVQALPGIGQCPVTVAPAPAFAPPAPYPGTPPQGMFWYGTPDLWTGLPTAGHVGVRDKSFWWRPGYNGAREQHPDLRITATSIATGFVAFMGRATNASHPSFGGWAMLVMLEFPSSGCWRVTGTYDGHSVTFVTFVSD